MFVSFDPARDWSGYDYVIIGAGVAGLFLAEKFAAHGRVLILEAGGNDVGNADGDGYYNLDVTGRGYASLGQRLTVFGGTSNHWGGHSHPLSEAIFDNRKGFPGWPITYQDYALHLPEAMAWLSLGPFEKHPGSTGIERDLIAHAQNLKALHFQFSNTIRRFGDQATQQHYAAASDSQADVKRRTLLERLAAFGMSRDEVAPSPAPDRQTAMPQLGYQAAPQQRPQPSPTHADYAKRPAAPMAAHRQPDAHGRPVAPVRPSDDDQLEIPAFLRRQTN